MRQATPEDLLELLRMGRAFAEAAGIEIDRERLVETMEGLMQSDEGLLIVDDGAMLAGVIYQSPFGAMKIAQELWWWVDEDKRESGLGIELLEGFEAWAGFNGADRVIMVALQSLTPRKVGKLYRGRDYVPLEHSYVKEL